MCLAAMYVSGIQRGFYAYSIDDVPNGLSRGGMMYEQLRKPIREQSIRLEHHPLPSNGESPYAVWRRIARGKRR